MDTQEIEGAKAAKKALANHHYTCAERCKNMGWGAAPRGPEKRCDEGTRLYEAYMAFRPAPIAGERLPGSKEKVGVEKHVLGNITVWAYRVDASKSTSLKDWQEHGEVRHTVFVDDDLRFAGMKSLDGALVSALAEKYSGHLTGADYYACKVLGMPTGE